MTILTLTKVDVGMMEDVGTSANKIIQLDSNAKIPAVDASLLTNMSSALSGSSDPTLSTNPSGGVGTKYKNTTDGEMFICTDATAGANVWTNVGAGTGNVAPFHGTGSNYGYAMGSAPGPTMDTIQKFSFTSASDSVDVANLTTATGFATGASSATHGYRMGGDPGGGAQNIIDKHQFGTSNNATDVGDLVSARSGAGGHSSETYGFFSGGYPATTNIQKVSFSTDGNATAHGDLAIAHNGGASTNSSTHGYHSHGAATNLQRDKFAFASNVTAVDDGDGLTGHHSYMGGVSSSTHGYAAGGAISGAGASNVIDKFSYVSGGNATDVGDLTQNGYAGVEVSQTDYGYKGGGGAEPANQMDRIEKWTFASDNNSVDTGANMLVFNAVQQSMGYHAPAQY